MLHSNRITKAKIYSTHHNITDCGARETVSDEVTSLDIGFGEIRQSREYYKDRECVVLTADAAVPISFMDEINFATRLEAADGTDLTVIAIPATPPENAKNQFCRIAVQWRMYV